MIPRLNFDFGLNKVFQFCFGEKTIVAKNEFLLNHARTGLIIALKSLKLHKGFKVGVMAFNCHTVMNAVRQSGGEIVFIDVDDNLRISIEDVKLKANCLDVLIITHLFGLLANIDKIRCLYPNLIIIEDCAHAYYSKFSNGDLAGSIGDFAVYSFGMAKFPVAGDGGMLRVNNNIFVKDINDLVNGVLSCNFKDSITLLMKCISMNILHYRLFYSWLTLKLKKKQSFCGIKNDMPIKRMANGTSKVLSASFKLIDCYVIKQRSNVEKWLQYFKTIDNENVISTVEMDLYNWNAFMLPIFCNDKSTLIALLKHIGVEAKPHFSLSIDWAQEFGYIIGSCPNTERLLKNIIVIPCYYKINVEKIVKNYE